MRDVGRRTSLTADFTACTTRDVFRKKLATTLLVGAVAFGSTGCIKKTLLNGQIASTRIGAGAADTIGDYELARAAASAGLLQFEGMHRLAPDNEDALFLLMKSWAGYGYAFAMDDYEAANLADDEPMADYHKKRTKLALERSLHYGLELIGHDAEGFEAAMKNADTLKAWLKKEFDDKDDAENLFWVGSAWLARVQLLKDQPEYVAKLYVGVAMLERSREIAPEYMAWGATSTLGAYHARSPMAELDEAKKLLDQALEKTGRKALGIQVNYAKVRLRQERPNPLREDVERGRQRRRSGPELAPREHGREASCPAWTDEGSTRGVWVFCVSFGLGARRLNGVSAVASKRFGLPK